MEDPLIGLFGGTFDPIHFGHLNLAIEIKEKCCLEEIWFIPTNVSPFRRAELSQDPHHRFEMVKLAIEGIEGFKALDIEVRRDPPSYTIETLELLEQAHPGKRFGLILSDDSYHHFSVWKESKKIRKKAELLIGRRKHPIQACVPTSLMDISGTMIRERLKKRLYCGHLVPAKVLDYIYENQLYFTPK